MSVTATKVPARRLHVAEKRRWIRHPSEKVRFDRYATEAARLVESEFQEKARAYEPLVNAKQLSSARNTGGDIARTIGLMMSNPSAARPIAALIDRIADAIDQVDAPDMETAFETEQRADGDEDVSQVVALIRRRDPEALRDYLRSSDRAMAALRSARAAAMRELEELES